MPARDRASVASGDASIIASPATSGRTSLPSEPPSVVLPGEALPPPADGGDGGVMIGRSLTAGNTHTCARMPDGTVRCWGSNSNGTLGDGTTTPRTTPVTVRDLSNVVEIASGVGHTCARLAD